MDEVKGYRRTLDSYIREYRTVRSQAEKEKNALGESQEKEANIIQAQQIIQSIAQGIQKGVHERIAGAVGRCLEAVFGESYGFDIRFEKKRGRTEARPLVTKGDKELDPLDGVGGGVLDVAAFALRVVCLSMARPHARKLLVLDEPFRCVSEGYRPAVAALVSSLAEEMNFQFVICTHDAQFQIGKIISM